MQHAVVQKRLSVLRPVGRHAAPPPWGDADGPLGFWEFGGDTGRLVLPRVYRHSRHLQPPRHEGRSAGGFGDRLYVSIMSSHVCRGDWSTRRVPLYRLVT